MRIASRRSLATMSMPYAVRHVRFGGRDYVLSAPEDVGATRVFDGETWEEVAEIDTPGGCMDFLQLEADEPVYTIMGCFVGYQFHGAGLYKLSPPAGTDLSGAWQVERCDDLPFGHRLGTLPGASDVFATTIAATKATPEDWSEPGSVRCYATGVWDSYRVVIPELHRNHGIANVVRDGRDQLWVSGMEGVFAIEGGGDEGHVYHRVLEHDVSEMALLDLDGDGRQELVTIEPFHGDTLKVYRDIDDRFVCIGEFPLTYGHGLWAGALLGEKRIVVGDRAGSGTFRVLTPRISDTQVEAFDETIIADGVATANSAIIPMGDYRAVVFAANQREGAVSAYEIV